MYPPRRVLILRPGALGDTLLALPAAAALRAAWVEAEFCWVGYPRYLEWLQGTPFVDAVRSIDDRLFCHLFDGETDLQLDDFLDRFDYSVAWVHDPERLLERRLGVLFPESHLLAPPYPRPDSGVHAAAHLVSRLAEAAPPEVRAHAARARLDCVLQGVDFPTDDAASVPTDSPTVMIHPGSGDARKNWPLECFAAVAEQLAVAGASVLWVLGPADAEIAARLRSRVERTDMRLLCEPSLERLAALARRSAAYLGNDSGVTHLAAGVGTPTFAVFGPTSPHMWAPQGSHVQVFEMPRRETRAADEPTGASVPNSGIEEAAAGRVAGAILAALSQTGVQVELKGLMR